jgi:hypothetical protein
VHHKLLLWSEFQTGPTLLEDLILTSAEYALCQLKDMFIYSCVMLGTRQRKDTLFRYLAVVWFRAVMPRQALWRVGAQAKVSDTYSREVDPRARVVRGEQVYDREMLSILTSRAYARGIALAENAARGRFPSYDLPEYTCEMNWRELWRLIESRRKWYRKLKKARLKRE